MKKWKLIFQGYMLAGDCTSGILQVSKAVYEGMIAGTEVSKFVRDKKEK